MARKTAASVTETVELPENGVQMNENPRFVEAEFLPLNNSGSFDPDSENNFQDWADALGDARSGYILRAYRLPTDERGKVSGNASMGQSVFLGAWPLDSMKFDELMFLLRDEYMLPGMQTMMVRLMVAKEGERGVKKNQIVQVQRALRASAGQNAAAKDSPAELMRAMQENNAVMMQQFQQMLSMSKPAPVAQRDPFEMMVAMMGAIGPLITAVAGRPQPAGMGMGEIVDVMVKMKELLPDGGGSDNSSDVLGIVKAIAPLAQPMLQSFAASAQERAALAVQQVNMPMPRLVNQNPQQPIGPVPKAQPGTTQPQSTYFSDSAAPAQPAMTHFNGGEIPMFMLQIRPQIQQLCDLAAQVPQPNPAEVAAMTLQSIPEEYDDKLGDLLFNENFMKWLSMLDTRVNDYRPWFEALHLELKKAFEDPDAPSAQVQ